jgi:hypothetical protein
MGAMGADHGPPQLSTVGVCARARGGGHAPVVAVLRASGKGTRANLRTQRGRPLRRDPFFLQSGNF